MKKWKKGAWKKGDWRLFQCAGSDPTGGGEKVPVPFFPFFLSPFSQPYSSNKAATTRRCSAARTLKVRQAAAVSIVSKPMPCRMMSVINCVLGNRCVRPVPKMMTSGSRSRAKVKSVMLRLSSDAGDQSDMISSAVRMTWRSMIRSFTCSLPSENDRMTIPLPFSRSSCIGADAVDRTNPGSGQYNLVGQRVTILR